MFAFANVLHMGPRDVERLTYQEFEWFCRALDQYQAANKSKGG